MIHLHELTRTFPRRGRPAPRGRLVRALDGVELRFPAGEVTAVVGPNGAGKSTLFSLVLGFLRPSEGMVEIEGEEPRRWVARHGAGYLPDRFALPDGWRVRPGLLALARLEGLDARAARAAVDRALERFGLGEHAGRRAGELSRGLLQRVGLAQVDLAPRRIVVLDEPGAGLDPVWRLRLREWITGLRGEGRVVLLASHDLPEVERVSGRVVLLEAGRVREVMTAEPASAPRRYTVRIESGAERLTLAFPGATEVAPGAWRVEVTGAAELSDRLGAALAAGCVVAAVEPEREPLEERVRRSLGPADREETP